MKLKVDLMDLNENHCALSLDEMSIDGKWEFDESTKQYFGTVTFPEPNQNHPSDALVFMIGGLTTRWKQVVGYHFTDKKSDGNAYKNIVVELIKESEKIGLLVHSVTNDMGTLNQAMWSSFGIKCTRTPKGIFKIVNSIEHPLDPNRKLYFIPDVPHIFKNITNSFNTNSTIYFSEFIVKKYNLDSPIANFKYVKKLFESEKENEFKIAPKLQEHHFQQDNFQKMRVGNSTAIMSYDVACGIEFYNELSEDKSYKTTCWYIRLVTKWFDIMSNRSVKLAFSQRNLEKYNETVQFLEDCVEVFKDMKVGELNSWKPIQRGLILASTSILQLQQYLIKKEKFEFVLTSRFSQDCVENLFSAVRSVQKKPSAKSFKNILKLIIIGQCLKNPKSASYDTDEREYISNFLDFIEEYQNPRTMEGTKIEAKPQKEIIIPLHDQSFNINIEQLMVKSELIILHYIVGYIFSRINNNNKVCKCCIGRYVNKTPTNFKYSKLTQAKQFKSGRLYYANAKTFYYFAKLELTFRYLREKTNNFSDPDVNYL